MGVRDGAVVGEFTVAVACEVGPPVRVRKLFQLRVVVQFGFRDEANVRGALAQEVIEIEGMGAEARNVDARNSELRGCGRGRVAQAAQGEKEVEVSPCAGSCARGARRFWGRARRSWVDVCGWEV